MGYNVTKNIKDFIFSQIKRNVVIKDAKLCVLDGTQILESSRHKTKLVRQPISTVAKFIINTIKLMYKSFPEVKTIVLCNDIPSFHKIKMRKYEVSDKKVDQNVDWNLIIASIVDGYFPDDWTTSKYNKDVRFLLYWRMMADVIDLLKMDLTLPTNIEFIIDNFGYINDKQETVYNSWYYKNGVENLKEATMIPDAELAMLKWVRLLINEVPAVFCSPDTDLIPILLMDAYLHFGNSCMYVMSITTSFKDKQVKCASDLYSIVELYYAIGHENILSFLVASLFKGNDTIDDIIANIGCPFAIDAFMIMDDIMIENLKIKDLASISEIKKDGRTFYNFNVNVDEVFKFIKLIFKMKFMKLEKDDFTIVSYAGYDGKKKYDYGLITRVTMDTIEKHLKRLKTFQSKKKTKKDTSINIPTNEQILFFIKNVTNCLTYWLNGIYLNKDEEIYID
jgi:hypothetical protein